MFNIGLYCENMKKISFNLNFMLDFIESAVRSTIKTVWWASRCFPFDILFFVTFKIKILISL